MSAILFALLLQTGPVVGHVVVTSVEENIFTLKLDPAHSDVRQPALYVKTSRCSRQATDEPARLLIYRAEDKAYLLFDGDSCEVTKVAEDRDGLER